MGLKNGQKKNKKKNTDKNLILLQLSSSEIFLDAPYSFYTYFVARAFSAARPYPCQMCASQVWDRGMDTGTKFG